MNLEVYDYGVDDEVGPCTADYVRVDYGVDGSVGDYVVVAEGAGVV